MNTLTEQDVRALAPSVFNRDRKSTLSERYIPYTTWDLLQPVLADGWQIYQAGQSWSRDPQNRFYKRHMVRLSMPHLQIKDEARIDALITNSNDGSSKFKVRLGVWRFICANGMVTGEEFDGVALSHRYAADQVTEVCAKVASRAPAIADKMDAWKAFFLSESQEREFIRYATRVRFPTLVNPPNVNVVRRSEDQGIDLWHTFQRVQEACLRGGQPYVTRGGRSVNTREIRSIGTNLSLNAKLWNAAEKMYSGADLVLPS